MTDQQPRATRDGITWDVGSRPPSAPATKPAGPPSPPTVPPKTSIASPEPTKRRRRWGWIIIAAVLAVLIAWSVYDRLTAPDGSTPPATSTGSAAGSTDAEKVAVTYYTAVLAVNADVACPLSADEASCRRVRAASDPIVTSQAPKALESARVQGTGGTATAVAIEYTVKGQDHPIRVVLFVREDDRKVIGQTVIGSDDQGKSLQQLYQEEGGQ